MNTLLCKRLGNLGNSSLHQHTEAPGKARSETNAPGKARSEAKLCSERSVLKPKTPGVLFSCRVQF